MSKQVISLGTGSNTHDGDPLRTAYSKINSNFSELYNAVLSAGVFDVVQYGAATDGTTDCTAAIQAAVDAARTYLAGGTYRSAVLRFAPGLKFLVNSTLNFTGFTTGNKLYVFGNGASIAGGMTGSPVIDAMGSITIYWEDLRIVGLVAPTIGIQIGRVAPTASNGGGNGMVMNKVSFTDGFTVAGLYNFSGESCTFINCLFHSSQSAAYGLIQDGINHFGVTSAFVSSTAPTDTAQSFNQNLFIRCTFISSTGQTANVWKSICRQHEYQSCYFLAPTSGYAFHEYCIAGGTSMGNKYDLQVEGSGTTPAGYFYFDGTNASPVIGGVEIRVPYIYAPTLFKVNGASSITGVTVRGFKLEMVGEVASAYSASFTVFDSPTLWTVAHGKIDILSASYWNKSASQTVLVNNYPHITCDMN
jgi:hypothetical protein